MTKQLEKILDTLKAEKSQEWLKGFEYCIQKVFDMTAETKTQKACVIMRDDGEYFERIDNFGQPLFTNFIQKAKLLFVFETVEYMNVLIKAGYNAHEFCKPVEIEIRVKEE